ncbi:YAP-binding/ALF4/Glomulin [Xylaria nigripes]|nr:YAP-binding/ALF4/Glomulin [Xylaria nigripes]
MPALPDSITAIREGAKEDRFTYLTILQYHVHTPGVLPTLNQVLQNADITQEIGWDLVQMLIGIDGCESCLETVARLGNPREVIIAVMETLAAQGSRLRKALDDSDGVKEEQEEHEEHEEEEASRIPGRLIILIGMLAILQRRIRTKHPSRFLAPSLISVLSAYHPSPEMTTAVINLVRSLSGRKRPPLPMRSSSIDIANPDEFGDISKNAPDPEAEQEDPDEENLKRRLLQCFTTCILQQYVNSHEMQWAPRLLEVYHPDKIVPGKFTATKAFRENEVLQKRDAIVGQLAALLRDLGLGDLSAAFVQNVILQSNSIDPMKSLEAFDSVDDIHLSSGGAACLIAYWMFSTDAFNADSPHPEMYLFPQHLDMMQRFLGTEPQLEINQNPGIADALLTIGLGLHHRGSVAATQQTSYMAYHHCLTLISVFHPDIQVRNAATRFAGTLLHSDPDAESRLDILEDLLENCQFPALKACAVKWFQEEIMAAPTEGAPNLFSGPSVIERLQYDVFPDMLSVLNMESEDFLNFWGENHQFLLQTANFAYYLFHGRKDLMPVSIGAAVEQRFAEPLVAAAKKFEAAEGFDADNRMQLDILVDRLQSINVR